MEGMMQINIIKNLAKNLKSKYRKEVAKHGYSENMSDKYITEFEKHVGDIYSYSYDDRLEINEIEDDLLNYIISAIK